MVEPLERTALFRGVHEMNSVCKMSRTPLNRSQVSCFASGANVRLLPRQRPVRPTRSGRHGSGTGVALAMGAQLGKDAELESRLRAYFGSHLTAAHLKLAEVPQLEDGAHPRHPPLTPYFGVQDRCSHADG